MEKDFGTRDKRGHYNPIKKVAYPPVFLWPPQPLKIVRWIFSLPGYLFPWNAFYALVGLLTWFYLSPALTHFSKLSPEIFFILFCRNSLLVLAYYGLFHYRLYLKKQQNTEFKFNPQWPSKISNKFIFKNQNIACQEVNEQS